MATSKCSEFDVLIIGAGLSGLTACYRLKSSKPDIRLAILEAGDRWGGRAYSPSFKVGQNETDRFNLGGEWIGEKQSDIMELLEELNIGTHPTYTEGKVAMEMKGKVEFCDNYYANDEATYQELLKRAKQFDDEIAQIDLSQLGDKELKKLEKMSLEDWMTKRGWPKIAKYAMGDFTGEEIDVDPQNVSFAFFVNYFQNQEITDSLYDDFKATFKGYRINNGSEHLADRLVDAIGSENVSLNSPVLSVDHVDPSRIIVETPFGAFTGTFVIIAVPPIAAKSIKFSPPLPTEKQKILDSYKPYIWDGEYSVKAVLTYEAPFWRNQGLSGYIAADYSTDAATKSTLPAMFVADATSAVGNAALVVFADLETSKTDRYQGLILAHLRQIFGESVDEFIDYKQMIWQTEDRYKGCVATIGPGKFRYHEFMKNIRQPIGGLHWAGTETAEKSSLLLSGAVNAGNRAAREILEIIDYSRK